MIIHPHFPKRRAKRPDAKVRELQSSWQEILCKYDSKVIQLTKKKSLEYSLDSPRKTKHHPSLVTNVGSTGKKDIQMYTGDSMIGISTLHKSNAIPVFRQQDAIDVAKMRRG